MESPNPTSRLLWVESTNPQAGQRPVIAFLPGGPGLSSHTLQPLSCLSRDFDLVFVDPPGTGGLPEVSAITFREILQSMQRALLSVDRKLVLFGHSFGGLYASHLALSGNLPLSALIAACSPLGTDTWNIAVERYTSNQSGELKSRLARWNASPSAETFLEQLAAYGRLFFREQNQNEAADFLKKDKPSYISFQCVQRELGPELFPLPRLKALSMPVLLLAGEEDFLFPADAIESEARFLGCGFTRVAQSAHFVSFDNPEMVARTIEMFLLKTQITGGWVQ